MRYSLFSALRHYFLLSIVCVITMTSLSSLSAQCPAGTLNLLTQADIDSFAIQYPHCTELPGSLIIQGGNITSLDSLYKLEKVNGFFSIQNTSIEDITGLQSLAYIGRSLSIRNNDLLTQISSMNHLVESGWLRISDNPQLEYISLDLFVDAGRGISFQRCSSLDSIHMPSMEVAESISLSTLPALTDLSGLSSLRTVTELVFLRGLGITSLNGLSNLEQVAELDISDNPSLGTLNGCPKLDTVEYRLTIDNNDNLTDINAFDSLNAVGHEIIVIGNAVLSACNQDFICNHLSAGKSFVVLSNGNSCSVYDSIVANCGVDLGCPQNVILTTQEEVDSFIATYPTCSTIPGNLLISGSGISDLSSLTNITSVGKELIIEQTNLTSLDGLDNIEFVGEDLRITDNTVLQHIDVFNKLRISGDGRFQIFRNSSLVSISGFHSLKKIFGETSISDNPVLEAITGFDSLSFVNGLTLRELPLLDSFNAFNALVIIDDEFGLADVNLDIVNAFDALREVSELQIEDCTGSTLDLFPSLELVEASLEISSNEIETLSGFSSLTRLPQVIIDGNAFLQEITGFQNLDVISDDFELGNNSVLTSLSGFSNLQAFGGFVLVEDNGSLSACAISALCSYINNGGSPIFTDNFTNCNSEEEVTAECTTCPNCFTRTTNTWTGSGDGSNWSDPGNWSLSIIPADCHDVIIPSGFDVTVDIESTCQSLTLRNGSTLDNGTQLMILGCD